MNVLHRCCPFQGAGFPRILHRFFTTVNAVEEVDGEDKLRQSADKREDADHLVDIYHSLESFIRGVRVIPAWYAGQSHEVHREEYAVYADDRKPEMQVAQALVHHATEHTREPMIDTCKHSEDGR